MFKTQFFLTVTNKSKVGKEIRQVQENYNISMSKKTLEKQKGDDKWHTWLKESPGINPCKFYYIQWQRHKNK